MAEMDYKKAFEWVCEQVNTELGFVDDEIGWIQEYDEEITIARLRGMAAAYSSIKRLCDNIKKYGINEYDKMCEETCKKYEES